MHFVNLYLFWASGFEKTRTFVKGAKIRTERDGNWTLIRGEKSLEDMCFAKKVLARYAKWQKSVMLYWSLSRLVCGLGYTEQAKEHLQF